MPTIVRLNHLQVITRAALALMQEEDECPHHALLRAQADYLSQKTTSTLPKKITHG